MRTVYGLEFPKNEIIHNGRRNLSVKKGDVERRADGVYVLSELTEYRDGSMIGIWIKKVENK